MHVARASTKNPGSITSETAIDIGIRIYGWIPCLHMYMDAKTYSIRLHAPEAEKVEQLTDEQGYTKSEAVRRLVEDGIEHRSNASDRLGKLAGSFGWASLSVSLAALALNSTTPAGVAAGVAAVLFVVSAVVRWRGGL